MYSAARAVNHAHGGIQMARTTMTASWTRRNFIKTAGLFGGAAAAGWPGAARAQALKPITASHSISTFVYGQHLVAAQKKFFEAEGLMTPDFVVPGRGQGGAGAGRGPGALRAR